MTEIRKKLGASALALALVVGLAGAGCVDHSGDKSPPPSDASVTDTPAGDDAPTDTPVATDTPADSTGGGDTAGGDTRADAGATDTGAGDGALDVTLPVDVRLDGTGG
jgi:hypothetical protein